MKKKITAIINTGEDNDKILKCLKVYFLNSFKNPDKQLIEINIEDIEKENGK